MTAAELTVELQEVAPDTRIYVEVDGIGGCVYRSEVIDWVGTNEGGMVLLAR